MQRLTDDLEDYDEDDTGTPSKRATFADDTNPFAVSTP